MSTFNKVAIIGSGLMGSGIAAQIANSGTKVLLLDIVSKNSANRNFISEKSIETLLKTKPAPLMHKRNAKLITPGNIEDHMHLISECEWVCEVVVENLSIKHEIYKKIEKFCSKDTIISSNTSTIPLSKLTSGFSNFFKEKFMITHFFNPPRYMPLLEVVPGKETKQDYINRIVEFSDIYLGKEIVVCKDTPGFIANRIGIFWSMVSTQKAYDLDLTIEEADSIVGKPMGVPKTGIFGLMDLTGIDLKDHVIDSMFQSLPKNDSFFEVYKPDHPLNPLTKKMVDEGYIGRKGKGGFYRLIKEKGEKRKQALDLNSGEYREVIKPNFESIKSSKNNLKKLITFDDKGAAYAWEVLSNVLKYAADLIPEISDDILSVDMAMKSGYAWKYGPFELIDQLGTEWITKRLGESNMKVPEILKIANGRPLYRIENNKKEFLSIEGEYKPVPFNPESWTLEEIKLGQKPLFTNKSASIWDIGDGVACLEFHSKMNAVDNDTLSMVKEAAKIDKKGFKALVIGNDSRNFSAGANIGMALFAANLAMWPLLEQTFKEGQSAYKALKFSPFPVVAAPAGMALGGGCEVCLHVDYVNAHSELYMGLVEVGVGIVPGWGGVKEMIFRHIHNAERPGGPMPALMEVFQTIGLAKVSTSADEAKDLLFLGKKNSISMNRKRLLADAKKQALKLAKDYTPPSKEDVIFLPGETAKIAFNLAINDLRKSGKISDHDVIVAKELAKIVSGGKTDILEPVDEKHILNLELIGISKLFKEPKSLDRMEYMLTKGKPLRN
ncbi:MAG: 3-hydroxyacyl-CoA dehydrogenase [Rhodospirillaceae bacterium]|nr:3-hydroxyacyl-CoA dehydrogenase [Rhodospirillaceae bacterium]|tara:strand:- start:16617 stop:18956 length:2340 start_codon:yes stop_codon:yes gene_type:complete